MLVAPINKLVPTEERMIEFKGLNKRAMVEDGEMSAMKNLTSDGYPVLRPRNLRGKMTLPNDVVTPIQIISRYEHIAMLAKDSNNNVNFYFSGLKVSEVTGLNVNSTMVAINNKICFFPQHTYVELDRSGQVVKIREITPGVAFYGNLDASLPSEQILTNVSTSDAGQTITFSNVVPLSDFKVDDAISITGILTPTGGTAINVEVACPIKDITNSSITVPAETFIELTTEGVSTGILQLGVSAIQRVSPTFNYATDHIIEWNNRLWMACYEDNTIYACKLGDPTNWSYYQSTSLDSYYAEQGTDGEWTGVGAYSQHLIFFKEHSMTKIYGTAPSNFQITNTVCYGIEEGSSKSVVAINDMIFYKSPIGIMCYEGSAPYSVTDKFGDLKYKNCVAGTDGRKYYASFDAGTGDTHEYHLMVLDIDRAVWHEEDSTNFAGCCTHNNHLYFISGNNVWITDGDTASESNMDWMATFGPFDEYVENKKIYSKLSLRLNAKANSSANVYIKMDDGEWELVNTFSQAKEGGVFIPIVPRRCDRYSVKITGAGVVEFKALTRRYRVGGSL